MDGRVLNSLTRKDIERHLNIVDRSHQTSITLGIELLAKYSYDLEKLTVKRAGCQNIDRDVEVSSEEYIGLGEYSVVIPGDRF